MAESKCRSCVQAEYVSFRDFENCTTFLTCLYLLHFASKDSIERTIKVVITSLISVEGSYFCMHKLNISDRDNNFVVCIWLSMCSQNLFNFPVRTVYSHVSVRLTILSFVLKNILYLGSNLSRLHETFPVLLHA